LDLPLVDQHFSISPLPLLACELVIVLGFLNLIHGGSVGEVLDLARWDPFLLLLPLNSLLDGDILLNTKLLHIFLEVFVALDHLHGVLVELLVQLILENLNLSIFKVHLSCDLFGPCLSILLPVLLALLFPLLHELLVLIELSQRFLPFLLLKGCQHIYFSEVALMSSLL